VVQLVLPGDRLVKVEARAVPDLVDGNARVEAPGRPVGLAERDGRDEDLPATENATGLGDQIANNPALVVQEKVHNATDVAVGGTNRVLLEIFQASKHDYLLLTLAIDSLEARLGSLHNRCHGPSREASSPQLCQRLSRFRSVDAGASHVRRMKEERIILIELAGPGTAALVCCSSDRLEAPDWRPRAPLLDPGMALARDSICGEAATRESAHSRNFRALNQEGSATHMESMPAAMTEVSGLSSDEAHSRLQQFGSNSIPDTSVHPVRSALRKFWAPVPWMLEIVVVVELCLHEYVEALVIAVLLIFNAALSFFREGHAQATLTALKSRLALTASARRDGAWSGIPAAIWWSETSSSCHSVKSCRLTCACWKVPFWSISPCLRGSRYPSKPGRSANLCGSTDSTGRGGGRGHRNRNSNQVWTDG